MALRFMLILAAVLTLGVVAPMAHDGKQDDCPLCEEHKQARVQGRGAPYHGQLVCIRGEVAGPAKVTMHFLDKNGKEFRSQPHTKIVNGRWQMKVGRHWFERVKLEGGIVRVCAGEEGERGIRFEEHNIDEHLKNGPLCTSESVCLFPDLKCPSGKW